MTMNRDQVQGMVEEINDAIRRLSAVCVELVKGSAVCDSAYLDVACRAEREIAIRVLATRINASLRAFLELRKGGTEHLQFGVRAVLIDMLRSLGGDYRVKVVRTGSRIEGLRLYRGVTIVVNVEGLTEEELE